MTEADNISMISLEELKNATMCIVCYQTYTLNDRAPTCLPCGHTFCRICVSKLGRNVIKCATCRHSTLATNTAKNYAVIEILNKFNLIKEDVATPLEEKPGENERYGELYWEVLEDVRYNVETNPHDFENAEDFNSLDSTRVYFNENFDGIYDDTTALDTRRRSSASFSPETYDIHEAGGTEESNIWQHGDSRYYGFDYEDDLFGVSELGSQEEGTEHGVYNSDWNDNFSQSLTFSSVDSNEELNDENVEESSSIRLDSPYPQRLIQSPLNPYNAIDEEIDHDYDFSDDDDLDEYNEMDYGLVMEEEIGEHEDGIDEMDKEDHDSDDETSTGLNTWVDDILEDEDFGF